MDGDGDDDVCSINGPESMPSKVLDFEEFDRIALVWVARECADSHGDGVTKR